VQWRRATSCARAELLAHRRARGSRRPPYTRATSLGKQQPDPAGRPHAYSAVEPQQAEHEQRRAGDLPACGRSSSSPFPPRAVVRRPVRAADPCGRRHDEEEERGTDAWSLGWRTWRRRRRLASRGATRAPPRGAHLRLGEAAAGVDGEHRLATRPLARGRGNQPPGWMREGMQEATGKPLLFGGVFFSLLSAQARCLQTQIGKLLELVLGSFRVLF
jgi:hypothetical protein